MRVDSHMHTILCGHAIGSPIEYAKAAAKQGIDVMTITCHIPMEWQAFGQQGIRMRRDQLDQYRALVKDTRKRAKEFGVEVLCGIEAEVYPDEAHMAPMDEILAEYEWDFVLGSLHAQCFSYITWLRAHKVNDVAACAVFQLYHLAEGA